MIISKVKEATIWRGSRRHRDLGRVRVRRVRAVIDVVIF